MIDMKHIYEINTATWLSRLSQQYNQPITLANVPDDEIDRLAKFGMDTVWLMGVWQRSPVAAEISRNDANFHAELRELLPDFTSDDIIGSAYAIKSYTIDERFGGEAALQAFRRQLAARDMKLLLDFVPNHTAFDHPWVTESPLRYITRDPSRVKDQTTHQFRACGGVFVAKGQDPTLAPWNDVAQLNAFSKSYRAASIETLQYISTLADGVRCDMAMLLINDIFSKTWGELAGPVPSVEYWHEVIQSVRQTSPTFTFIAECYWETEAKLVELGFDYVYDKTTYDYLARYNQTGAEYHLESLRAIENHLLHFLENHDEPRASSLFSADESLLYVEFIKKLPGVCLWHDGQFEGYRKRVPVHIRRGPHEPVDEKLYGYYKQMLSTRP